MIQDYLFCLLALLCLFGSQKSSWADGLRFRGNSSEYAQFFSAKTTLLFQRILSVLQLALYLPFTRSSNFFYLPSFPFWLSWKNFGFFVDWKIWSSVCLLLNGLKAQNISWQDEWPLEHLRPLQPVWLWNVSLQFASNEVRYNNSEEVTIGGITLRELFIANSPATLYGPSAELYCGSQLFSCRAFILKGLTFYCHDAAKITGQFHSTHSSDHFAQLLEKVGGKLDSHSQIWFRSNHVQLVSFEIMLWKGRSANVRWNVLTQKQVASYLQATPVKRCVTK